MESSSVNWDLLPDHPEEFFGFTDGVDRKELKKRYHRLIKQFKPERFPTEFQRIRAAFDLVDERLRYAGQTGETLGRGSHEPSPEFASAAQPNVRAHALQAMLQVMEPQAIYRELQSEPNDPFDYFALAVLSDAADSQEKRGFATWILEGFEKHPEDAGLLQLLHAYCRTEMPTPEQVALVRAVAEIAEGPLYFYLCEDLWLRLFKSLPFDEFAELLDECEGKLKRDALVGRLTFYVRILRAACWRADETCLNERVGFVEENVDLIPEFLQLELELLERLLIYRRSRSEFLNGATGRSRLDAMLRTYFEGDELEGEKAFLEWQLYVQKRPEEVLEAFPIGQDVFEPAMVLFRFISQDMESRLLDDDDESEMNSNLVEKVWHLAYEQQRRSDRSLLGTAWRFSIWTVSVGQFVPLFAPIIWLVARFPYLSWLLAGWIAAWYYLVYKFARERALVWLAMTFSSRLYRRYWRDAIIRMVRISRTNPYAVTAILHQIEDPEIHIHHLFGHYLSQDPALSFFAYSHRFV